MKNFLLNMNNLRVVLVFAAALMSGCSPVSPHMIPTPSIYLQPSIDLYSQRAEDQKTTKLPVFYATTRAPALDSESHYLDKPGSDLVLGRANVQLGEPGWDFDSLIASDRRDTFNDPRSGHVVSVKEFGRFQQGGEAEKAFIDSVNARLDKTNKKTISLYIHGYKVFFNEVTVMMASWSHYLNNSAIMTFQWPTGQNFWNYLTDCPNAEQYIPDITRTIKLLSQTNAESIHLMAYSCGSPLLASALMELRNEFPKMKPTELRDRFRISNVAFVASDIGLQAFVRDYFPIIQDLSQQVIVYFSEKDNALGWSARLAGHSRLGRPDLSDLSDEDLRKLAFSSSLTAVDVSGVEGAHEMGGMEGHGYWYANPTIATDILISLWHSIPPAERCLVADVKSNTWAFPDNYVDCIAERLLKIAPELAVRP